MKYNMFTALSGVAWCLHWACKETGWDNKQNATLPGLAITLWKAYAGEQSR